MACRVLLPKKVKLHAIALVARFSMLATVD